MEFFASLEFEAVEPAFLFSDEVFLHGQWIVLILLGDQLLAIDLNDLMKVIDVLIILIAADPLVCLCNILDHISS